MDIISITMHAASCINVNPRVGSASYLGVHCQILPNIASQALKWTHGCGKAATFVCYVLVTLYSSSVR